MTLATGTRIGVYEITAPIGAGGMGEVYRARDTKLQRDVAIKVLPELFANNRDRLARFEREAQSLAALNHPHIAQIYGVTEQPSALVMEFVDGDDLSSRVASGPIPVGEALILATQIAEALEAAHERGIIHRDLKPANIKVSEDGGVKVLDFGLAKALAPDVSTVPAISDSPTCTSPAMTQLGMILGTAAYMAPEQAKGKMVDRRVDVWAFGGVLFEMLTAKRPFDGEDVTDVIASIMRAEPEWNLLPADTPTGIRKLLKRCLEKDRAKRLDSMAVARYEIQEALATPQTPVAPHVVAAPRRSRLALVAVALVSLALGALAAWAWLQPRTPSHVTRAHLTPPPPLTLALDTFGGDLDISPDGQAVVYTARRGEGPPELFLRRLDQSEGVPVPGTVEGRSPSFSPDGKWLVFQVGTDIKRVPVGGGAQEQLCVQCAGGYRGTTWLPDGSMLYSTAAGVLGLRIAKGEGNAIDLLTHVDVAAGERGHVFPQMLPNGKAVLFVIEQFDGTTNVALFDLATKKTTIVARGGSSPRYVASGHVLFAANGVISAVPFDQASLAVTGAANPVVDGIVTKSSGAADYAVSKDGTLVYVQGAPVSSTYSVAIASRAKGPRQPLPLGSGTWVMGRFSPDDKDTVFDSRSGAMDLWVWNFAANSSRRLTFSPFAEQYPVWTPDGKQIVYTTNEGGSIGLYRRNADSSGAPEKLTTLETTFLATTITPDGQTVIAQGPGPNPSIVRALYTIELKKDAKPQLLEGLAQLPLNADLSRDGKWLAYQTAESGRPEIIVHPYPNISGGRWQVTTTGGSQPHFSAKGDELFYRDAERRLVAVSITPGAQFTYGSPVVIAENVFSPGPGRPYDVSSDGQRILLMEEARSEGPAGPPPQLQLVLNWLSTLAPR